MRLSSKIKSQYLQVYVTINNMLSQSILCEVGYGYSGVDVTKKIGSDSYTLGKYPSRMTLSCKLAQKSL